MITAARRLAVLGSAVAVLSLAAPWWDAVAVPGSRSPLESPGPADGAIALVAVAVVALVMIRSRRPEPTLPRPLGEGGLLVVAAIWLAGLIAVRALAAPDFGTAAGATQPRLGIAIAALGAAMIGIAGARLRIEHRKR